MTVDLSPVDELSLADAITDVVDHPYCGNCTHLSTANASSPHCDYHDAATRIEFGAVCPQYVPQGMEHVDEPTEQ